MMMIHNMKSTFFKSKRKQFSWLRTGRYYYLRLLRLDGQPVYIARGLACGVFAGCFPWFGLQTIIGVLLAILGRGNKLAAVAGTWISNPLTYVPIFAFNYNIGKFILGNHTSESLQLDLESSLSSLIDLGWSVFFTLFLGSFVVGLVAAIVTYFLSLRLITARRRQKNIN